MPYTDDGKAAMLYALKQVVRYVSLHDEDGDELPLGIYKRQHIDLLEPYAGETKSSREMKFQLPPGTEVRFVGFWNLETSGVMLAFKKAPETMKFRGKGVLVIDTAALDLNLEEEE